MESQDAQPAQEAQEAAAGDASLSDALQLLDETVARFQSKPSMAGAHDTAQRAYDKFCRNRTAQLHATFYALVGMPDFAAARFNPKFGPFALPTGGCKEQRCVEGMEQGGRCHGVIRYEYKASIIEECHMEGKEHGLRVVCTQVGQIWLRLYKNGERMAQIVLNGDSTVAAMPKPIDDGGLKTLQSHLHLIQDNFKKK
jgi:hypothetical protein